MIAISTAPDNRGAEKLIARDFSRKTTGFESPGDSQKLVPLTAPFGSAESATARKPCQSAKLASTPSRSAIYASGLRGRLIVGSHMQLSGRAQICARWGGPLIGSI
jgi:hypothetical protein